MAEPVDMRGLFEAARKPRQPWRAPLSYRKLAERVELSRTYLYALMNGTKVPSSATLHRIARGLRVPVREVEEAWKHTRRRNRDRGQAATRPAE